VSHPQQPGLPNERTKSHGFWFVECAAAETRAPRARNLKTKPMIDLIFIAVITLFFVASGLYACWCEKL